jgi:membrane associated rhomboid family serine protease
MFEYPAIAGSNLLANVALEREYEALPSAFIRGGDRSHIVNGIPGHGDNLFAHCLNAPAKLAFPHYTALSAPADAMQPPSPEPDDIAVTVFSSRYQGVCHERGLVLRAVGIAYRVRKGEEGWRVEVSPLDANRAREEIEAYNREQSAPVSVPAPIEQRSDGVTGVVVFCMVMLFFFVLDKRGIFGIDWLAAGRLDAGDMRAGQWWRAVTALTLHLDAAHLAANLSFGAFFGLFVGQYLGQGAGWLAILLSGAAGNVINALVQAENHLLQRPFSRLWVSWRHIFSVEASRICTHGPVAGLRWWVLLSYSSGRGQVAKIPTYSRIFPGLCAVC